MSKGKQRFSETGRAKVDLQLDSQGMLDEVPVYMPVKASIAEFASALSAVDIEARTGMEHLLLGRVMLSAVIHSLASGRMTPAAIAGHLRTCAEVVDLAGEHGIDLKSHVVDADIVANLREQAAGGGPGAETAETIVALYDRQQDEADRVRSQSTCDCDRCKLLKDNSVVRGYAQARPAHPVCQ